jgi:hypothetical protein
LRRLTEQAHRRHLLLSVVDDAPVILAGHGIEVALAKKALIVRFHQLVDRIRVAAVFVVVDLNRPRILHTSMHRFDFFIPANRFRNLGCRDRERDQNKQSHEKDAEQQKTLLLFQPGL